MCDGWTCFGMIWCLWSQLKELPHPPLNNKVRFVVWQNGSPDKNFADDLSADVMSVGQEWFSWEDEKTMSLMNLDLSENLCVPKIGELWTRYLASRSPGFLIYKVKTNWLVPHKVLQRTHTSLKENTQKWQFFLPKGWSLSGREAQD